MRRRSSAVTDASIQNRRGIKRSAMHHPMSGRDQLMVLKVVFQPAQKRGQRIFMGGAFCQILIDQRSSGAVFRREMNAVPDTLALTVANDVLPARSFVPREYRELDARRTGIQHKDSVTHGFAPLWRASSSAIAQDPSLASVPSERLVRMIGTRAPSTMPAICASARYSSCFASMLPASRSGTTKMSARPATGEMIPFVLADFRRDRIVEGERTIENAAGNLASIGHLAKCGRIKGGLDLFRDDLDRGQDRHARFRYTQGVRQIDRVLDDVPLVRQRGVDVDRGVGDEERPRIVGRVDRKDVAYAPGGAQAAFAVDNSMHELIRMERAFHQRLDLAGAGHGDGLSRRGLAVFRRNDLVRCQIELSQRGGGANLEPPAQPAPAQ